MEIQPKKNLQQYIDTNAQLGISEFVLRISAGDAKKIILHPLGVDGETVEYTVDGNVLDKEPGHPHTLVEIAAELSNEAAELTELANAGQSTPTPTPAPVDPSTPVAGGTTPTAPATDVPVVQVAGAADGSVAHI
jgi:hypothetical protein